VRREGTEKNVEGKGNFTGSLYSLGKKKKKKKKRGRENPTGEFAGKKVVNRAKTFEGDPEKRGGTASGRRYLVSGGDNAKNRDKAKQGGGNSHYRVQANQYYGDE